MNTIRVSRGQEYEVGQKWYPGQEPQPAIMYFPVHEHDIEVPHTGANVKCHALLDDGDICTKRAGHPFRKGEKRHEPVDTRLVASPGRIVHARRFAPHGIPKGVDMNITTAGHVCSGGEGCPK